MRKRTKRVMLNKLNKIFKSQGNNNSKIYKYSINKFSCWKDRFWNSSSTKLDS